MQGNGTASQEFLLSAITLIKYLYKNNIFRINASNHDKIYSLAGQIFVDDSKSSITNKVDELELQIVSRSQEALDMWHTGLKFTGGELKLKKCYWNMQSFTWKDNLHK